MNFMGLTEKDFLLLQNGYYYRTRMPKAGRDMAYHYVQCDLYLAGAR